MDARPLIGVTIGDPAGVGPEIVARAVANPSLHQQGRLLVIGSAPVVEKAVHLIGGALSIHPIAAADQGIYAPGTLDLMDVGAVRVDSLQPGVVQPEAGEAAFRYVRAAIEMAMAAEIDGLATAPINKEALKAGGVPYLDHTEMLAKLTGSPDPMTLFVVGNLRIFFLTRHLSLVEACRRVTAERVADCLHRIDGVLRRLGTARPRIAVAGLNPHAGEGGLFGTEEIEQIAPGVDRARREGIDACGPIPADSVFFLTLRGKYDAVLSLYHDQGHIAAKTLDFERTVGVTVGLPILRTSVDHGTAFDIAWKGVASPTSMEEAIRVAAEYACLLRRDAGAGSGE